MSAIASTLTGSTLREARERAHMSQVEAAAQLRVPLRTYQSWEAETPPKPWPQHRLALKEFLEDLELAQQPVRIGPK